MKKAPFVFKRYKAVFLLGSIVVFAVCCNSTKPVAANKPAATNSTPKASNGSAGISYTTNASESSLEPAQSDLAIAKTHWPDVTMAGLNVGYSIYNDKCTDCHDAKLPQDFSLQEWNAIMPKMGRKAKLDSAQYTLVFHYILTRREAIVGVGK